MFGQRGDEGTYDNLFSGGSLALNCTRFPTQPGNFPAQSMSLLMGPPSLSPLNLWTSFVGRNVKAGLHIGIIEAICLVYSSKQCQLEWYAPAT